MAPRRRVLGEEELRQSMIKEKPGGGWIKEGKREMKEGIPVASDLRGIRDLGPHNQYNQKNKFPLWIK